MALRGPWQLLVVVSGAVNSPVAVSYVPGKNIDWYVNAAGGPTHKAEATRAWVTQPNGTVESRIARRLLPDTKPKPQPGSRIQVPERDPNEKTTDKVALVGSIAQVLASLVTIAVVVTRK